MLFFFAAHKGRWWRAATFSGHPGPAAFLSRKPGSCPTGFSSSLAAACLWQATTPSEMQ